MKMKAEDIVEFVLKNQAAGMARFGVVFFDE